MASKTIVHEIPKKIAMDCSTFVPTVLSHATCCGININAVGPHAHGDIEIVRRESMDITLRGSVDGFTAESIIRPSTDTKLEFKKASFDSDEDLDSEVIVEKEPAKSDSTNSKQFLVCFADGERDNPKASRCPMQRVIPVLTSGDRRTGRDGIGGT